MKKLFVLLVVFVSILLFDNAFADMYVYPDSHNPLFYVNFPPHWQTVAEKEIIYSTPVDESVFIILWSIEAKSFDSAVQKADTVLQDFFSEVNIEDTKQIPYNDILFKKFAGKAKLNKADINFSLSVFAPSEQTNFMLLYFGEPTDNFKYANEFNQVFYSIRKAKELSDKVSTRR